MSKDLIKSKFTSEERHIALELRLKVTFQVASWNKRFCRSMYDLAKSDGEATECQKQWLYRMVYTYRKQVPELYEKYKFHEHCIKAK